MDVKNVCQKYGITMEEYEEGVEFISKNCMELCNTKVLLAILEVLATGDISAPNTRDNNEQ